VGSKTLDGVWFISFADDHEPPHVHGQYGETTVIVDLLPGGWVAQSTRAKSVIPANAKRSDVRKILKAALDHAVELHELWETMHGTSAD
jgi:Domain of unknown function (DUF4160)